MPVLQFKGKTAVETYHYNDNLTQPQFKEWIDRRVGKEGKTRADVTRIAENA